MVSIAAAGSVAVFLASERAVFHDWKTAHYGPDDAALVAAKTPKLPPVDDGASQSMIVPTADDDFSRSLRSDRSWRRTVGRSVNNNSKYIRKVRRSNLIGDGANDLFLDPFGQYSRPTRRRVPQSGLYRTMCVRSCDGFMWPVSFSTSKSNLSVDENVCRNSCAAPTRLYYYENPGQEPADMVDRQGRRYSALPTAWRYQAQHNPSCKCKPDPWEIEALARHTLYASLQSKGRLKRFLASESRKARRMARRSSVGYVVANSSVSVAPTAGDPQAAAKSRRRAQSRPPRRARGFGAPKRVNVIRPKSTYRGRSSRSFFQQAFGNNR
ncbi:MAG: DUF2865 domain-containing protein [Pseudomonadota bacterium]